MWRIARKVVSIVKSTKFFAVNNYSIYSSVGRNKTVQAASAGRAFPTPHKHKFVGNAVSLTLNKAYFDLHGYNRRNNGL